MYRLFLFFLLLAVSCIPKEDKTFISGKIENPVTKSFEISYLKDYISNEHEIYEVILDENNSFHVELDIERPVSVYMSVEDEDPVIFYLEPNDELHLTADGEDIKNTLKFSGNNADNNSFITEYWKKLEDKYTQQQVIERMRELKPAEFMVFADKMLEAKQQLFNDFSKDKNLSDGFKHFFKTGMHFDYYDNLINYPVYHKMLNELDEKPELPENYYAFLKEALQMLSDENLVSINYCRFLGSYIQHYKRENPEDFPGDKSPTEINLYYAEKLYDGKSLDYIKAAYIYQEFNFGKFEDAKALYEDFMEEEPDKEYIDILSSIYETIKSLLPGNPAPGFELTDINGSKVSLGDFRGKVVYLDFWASWCPPCMREVPYAKKLKERFKDEEDLVFLYISVDEDKEAWRNTVEEKEIEGVHLNAEGRDNNVVKSYNVSGIPAYFIIDRNGLIFDNNAKRPSYDSIDDDLASALQKEKIS